MTYLRTSMRNITKFCMKYACFGVNGHAGAIAERLILENIDMHRKMGKGFP